MSDKHQHLWFYSNNLWRCRRCAATHLMLSPSCGGFIDLKDPETCRVISNRFSKYPTPPPYEGEQNE